MDLFWSACNAVSRSVAGFGQNVFRYLFGHLLNSQPLTEKIVTASTAVVAIGYAQIRKFMRNLEWKNLVHWFTRRGVCTTVASGSAFTAVMVFLAGFGSQGIVAGSLAATLQSVAYGGLTTAMPGVFATLTSMGMTGAMAVFAPVTAVSLAAVIGWCVWSISKKSSDTEEDEHLE